MKSCFAAKNTYTNEEKYIIEKLVERVLLEINNKFFAIGVSFIQQRD